MNPLISELAELVAALDRRAPQQQRSGEPRIAREAAELRANALKRIAELQAGRARLAS